MPAYRKKPVVIEAVQFTQELRDSIVLDKAPRPDGVEMGGAYYNETRREVHSAYFYIETLEGRMEVSINDWIITDVNGEHYPCKPDIFAKTYEPADTQPSKPLDEREAFEAWFEADVMPSESDWFKRNEDGEYDYSPTQCAWRGWQARAQQEGSK